MWLNVYRNLLQFIRDGKERQTDIQTQKQRQKETERVLLTRNIDDDKSGIFQQHTLQETGTNDT